MQLKQRRHGEEQPYWPAGPFKIRLPFVHYRWETAEMVQGLIMFVVSLSMVPLIEQYLGVPYDAAIGFVVVCGIGYLLPALLGVAYVPGWITPAIPMVLVFLGDFEPGPEAIRALFALQFLVFLIFFILGITGLGRTLVRVVPSSLQSGIIMGAGIASIMGEIQEGGRLANTPVSLLIGSFATIFLLFSPSFHNWTSRFPFAKRVALYGIVPGVIFSMLIGWVVGEYPLPDIEWGITRPDFVTMWQYLPFSVGFPGLDIFMLAVPTAVICYIIAFGDIVVGRTLIARIEHLRDDEKIDFSSNRLHHVTALRNLIHAFFAPYPGLSGPLWTAVMATIAERYKFGRDAMDSIYSGAGTFWITGLVALFFLPLVTTFQPVLPIALSLTLILTGYICLFAGMDKVGTVAERGVAGTTAVVLALYGAGWGLGTGVLLYVIVQKQRLFGFETPPPIESDKPAPAPAAAIED